MSKVGRPLKGVNERCLTKNAIAARLNRKKRKAYIESLEKQAAKLVEEIDYLKAKTAEDERKTEEMNRDISSLKNILSKISDVGLLKHDAASTISGGFVPGSH